MKAALAIAAVSVGLILGFLVWVIAGRTDEGRATCREVNNLKGVLVTLIDRGDSNLRKYHHEGLINTEQLRRSLKQSQQAREDLAPDSCD